MRSAMEEIMEGLDKVKDHINKVEALKVEVQDLKTELSLCKLSIMNGVMPIQVAHKLDVSKTKEFKGN